MKFVYAIMAHHAPEQLCALIERLAAGPQPDRIVLHLDKRSALWRTMREELAAHPSGKVEIVADPAAVRWAHHSQAVAQHRLLLTALRGDFDYFHLISGVDWPIASRASAVADIGINSPRLPVFIQIDGEMDQPRMQDWWFDERKFRFARHPRLEANVERAQTRASWAFSRWWNYLGWKRRRYLDQPWIKGSTWFSLPRDVAQDVCNELGDMLANGRLLFTQCADEHAVPTILARRHGDRIAPSHRYIDWSAGGYHPKLLTRADRDAMIASGAWFARKLDMTIDDFFLNRDTFPSGNHPPE